MLSNSRPTSCYASIFIWLASHFFAIALHICFALFCLGNMASDFFATAYWWAWEHGVLSATMLICILSFVPQLRFTHITLWVWRSYIWRSLRQWARYGTRDWIPLKDHNLLLELSTQGYLPMSMPLVRCSLGQLAVVARTCLPTNIRVCLGTKLRTESISTHKENQFLVSDSPRVIQWSID